LYNNKDSVLLLEILLIGLIIFLASFNQGFSGFGFAITSIPLLSLIIDVKIAIPLAAICGMILNFILAYKLKNFINFSELKLLIVGSIIGIPIGAIFLSKASPDLILKILAVVILVFVIINTTHFIKPFELHKKWGVLFGLISGVLGGAFNTNGPPILVYFYLKDWNKFKQKAMITGFFIVASILIVSSHAVSGVTTKEVLVKAAFSFPFLIGGLFLGMSIFPKISTRMYRKLILTFLAAISIILILR